MAGRVSVRRAGRGAGRRGEQLYALAPGVAERVSDLESPPGLFAVVVTRSCPTPTFSSTAEFVVVADRVGEPGNLGTIVRSAEAAGADAVVVTPGTVDETNPKVVRASAGALFHVPVVPATLGEVASADCASSDRPRIVARRTPTADWSGRIAIVAGNEASGLDARPGDRRVGVHRAPRSRREPQRGDGDDRPVLRSAPPAHGRRAAADGSEPPGADRVLPPGRRWLEWFGPRPSALVPFVVAVVRATVKDWTPVGDAAYFTVRSADVLTAHHPLVGAWSSGSSVVGVPVNNLGPLQLDLLAPFTKVTPYLGTAIGSALINAASVVAVWTVARRMFRPAVVVAVMLGTTLFVASLGLSWLIDARQQAAMVLPLFALLWMSAAMWMGVRIAVPIALVVASLIIQTHFTYAYQPRLVFVVGVVGLDRRHLAHRGRLAPGGDRGRVVLGALCWIQPLLDQFGGTGTSAPCSARRVIGPVPARGGGPDRRRGRARAAVLAPGSMGTFLLPYDGISLAGAVAAVSVWLVLATVVAVLGCTRGAPAARAVGIAPSWPSVRRWSPRRGSRPRRSGSCRRTTTGRGRSLLSSRWPSSPGSARSRPSPLRCAAGRSARRRALLAVAWWRSGSGGVAALSGGVGR